MDKCTDEEFYNLLPKLFDNYIGINALNFYLDSANSNHLTTLEEFKVSKAKSYVEKYNQYLDKHFSNFKESFNPYTNGKIGILMSNDLIGDHGYALIPYNENYSQSVQLANTTQLAEYETCEYYGAQSVYTSSYSIFQTDQEHRITENINSQLKKIIYEGNFPIFKSEIIYKELFINSLYFFQKKLKLDIDTEEFYVPRYEVLYPLKLSEVEKKIYYFMLYEYYKEQYIHPKEINLLVEKAILSNDEIPSYNRTGSAPPINILLDLINKLKELGYKELKSHHLPLPVKTITETKNEYKYNSKRDLHEIIHFQYGKAQAKLYVIEFFKSLDIAYKEFVDHFFPTLKSKMKYYCNSPYKYYIFMKEDAIVGYSCKKSKNTEIEFIPINNIQEAYEHDGLNHFASLSLNMIIQNSSYSRPYIKTFKKFKTPELDKFCIIRYWIFKRLTNDLNFILKKY